MKERRIDCQTHVPEVSIATVDHTYANPDKIIYSTLRSEDGTNPLRHETQTLPTTGEEIRVPVFGKEDVEKITGVIVESRQNVRFLKTEYGKLPYGGFREDVWIDEDAKRQHFHLEIPASIDSYTLSYLMERIEQTPCEIRQEKFDSMVKMLPKVQIFSDKGLSFSFGNEPAVSLVPVPIVHKDNLMNDEDEKVLYNFNEGEYNQPLQPYESEFYYEYSTWQEDDTFVLPSGAPAAMYLIARVSFGQNVDSNYINTYLESYSEHKGLNDEIIRSLVNPQFAIYLQSLEE